MKTGRTAQVLWAYTEKIAADELKDEAPESFAPVSAEQVRDTIQKIDHALEGKEISKKKRQQINYAKKHWPVNVEKYAQQEKILAKRNSYSKTYTDATFMRMKEDHMRNGQLKPAYNVQLSSNNQFVVNYTLHQNPTDTTTIKTHLDNFHFLYTHNPQTLTADAGYGSEENYLLLDKRKITGYVKHNQFDREQRNKEKDWFKSENLEYNKKEDIVYCPLGEPMHNIGTATRITANGFKQTLTNYQATKCKRCPVRDAHATVKEVTGLWVLTIDSVS